MRGKVQRIKKCENCGNEFRVWRVDGSTCSDKCRAANNRNRKRIKKLATDIFGMLEEINQAAEKRGGTLPDGIYQDLKRSHEAIEYLLQNHAYQMDLFAGDDSDWRRDNPQPIMYIPNSAQTENQPS